MAQRAALAGSGTGAVLYVTDMSTLLSEGLGEKTSTLRFKLKAAIDIGLPGTGVKAPKALHEPAVSPPALQLRLPIPNGALLVNVNKTVLDALLVSDHVPTI